MKRLTGFNRFKARGFFIPRVCLHFVVGVVISMLVGFVPEALVGNLYHGTAVEPFTPFVTTIAALLGVLLARKLHDTAALWTWVPGVLIFFQGVYELTRYWSPSWSNTASRWQYAFSNLLTPNCGSTECLYELLSTTPLVCSVAYSLTSYVVLRKSISHTESPQLRNGAL
jgi:hypothetical protein